jgi:twinkle protein
MGDSFVVEGRLPCAECGSSDAVSKYSDGHLHCFSCGTHSHGDIRPDALATTSRKPRMTQALLHGEPRALAKRGITQETCEKWRYHIAKYKDVEAQVATYCDLSGKPLAQKVRMPNKKFCWIGEPKKVGLYGQHLWRDGGKKLVITEGEVDALTVSQLQGNKWPVVSIPNGAQGAAKDIAEEIEWVEKFEEVILMFDNDEHGREAAKAVAQLLTPGKAKIATLPLKDASDMHQAGRGAEVLDAMWGAKAWRPDEIVPGSTLLNILRQPERHAQVPYPYAGLNAKLLGLRQKEITTFCAGSGIGKSTIVGEIAHSLLVRGEKVAYIALEESVARTAWRILTVELSKPLHLIPEAEKPWDEIEAAHKKLFADDRFYTYDHFGSMDTENLFSRIKYLVTGCGCQWVVLDHLSIVVSGLDDDGDERKLIDRTMTRLRSLVEQLGFGLLLVSHLKGSEGKALEEGGMTHLNLLRGSRSIGQLSDVVLGLERNQQDPENKNRTDVRILKDRWTGETGIACHLSYDRATGRLNEEDAQPAFSDETQTKDQNY